MKLPTLYHGTGVDFRKPRLNWLGVLWLDPNPVVAAEYALPTWRDRGYLWTIRLKPGARFVDLHDLRAPAIRALFDAVNEHQRFCGATGAWSESEWAKRADFGILETYRWAARFLKSQKLDGVFVNDTIGTIDVAHRSFALLRLSTILSAEKVIVVRDPAQKHETIADLMKRMSLGRL